MPEMPPFRIWYIFAPWKYPTRWSRFRGWYCLYVIANAVVVGLTGVGYWYLWALFLGMVATMIVDIVRALIQDRKHRQTVNALNAWAKVIDGSVKQEELPPGVQEDIAVQRAAARTLRGIT